MIALKLTLAALVVSCAAGATRFPPRDLRPVAGTGLYLTTREWEHTPWHRAADGVNMRTPIHVIFSTTREACIVSGADWVLAVPNELYHCATRWRRPRP